MTKMEMVLEEMDLETIQFYEPFFIELMIIFSIIFHLSISIICLFIRFLNFLPKTKNFYFLYIKKYLNFKCHKAVGI